MKTYLDCIPCFVRQALDSIRFVTDDPEIHEQVLKKTLEIARAMDMKQPPPAMSRHLHHHIRELTGIEDPYREVKDRFNRFILELYPQLKAHVEASATPFETATRLAIAGNIIDFGVKSTLEKAQVQEAVDHALTAPLNGEIDTFFNAIQNAREILYIADNAGEIVFDKLLLEQLPRDKVTFVVRGAPIINDATMRDAEEAGIPDLVPVIDSGSTAPGTIIEQCSPEFQARFQKADLIISKGQGNYETLSNEENTIFFLLKVKCPVIERHTGCPVGSLILFHAPKQVQ